VALRPAASDPTGVGRSAQFTIAPVFSLWFQGVGLRWQRRHDESERLARRATRAHAGRSTRVRSCSARRQRCALFHRSHRRGGDGAARQGDL